MSLRQEMVPDWLKNENSQEQEKKELTNEDLQKIERMKQLQNEILNQKG